MVGRRFAPTPSTRKRLVQMLGVPSTGTWLGYFLQVAFEMAILFAIFSFVIPVDVSVF
ncbi:hypothetical protein QIQ50_gp3 [ssRNA phage SRR7976299_18]|uniref:Uncharacterized protein n=1 Tax=ssRNA phage SRR7976299_18 TaxID=2786640 RepID=A0A8S5KZD4_9VIRU|nr:hypothetical protein QIQ50_gp3 [ssRNA phage SRR7976299_18]DAD51078.1 TPA_asm: hypothetical protein [ssRNA phage SRR7976299_18]